MSCGCGGLMKDCYCPDDMYPPRVLKCKAGCKAFTGGEITHHKDCQFYSESLSEMMDKLKADLAAARGQIDLLNAGIEKISEGWQFQKDKSDSLREKLSLAVGVLKVISDNDIAPSSIKEEYIDEFMAKLARETLERIKEMEK